MKSKIELRKKILQKEINDARNLVREIEIQEKVERNRGLVGKYFKHKNSYSCPKPDEYFWFYFAVTGIQSDGELFGWSFQMDIYNKIEIDKSYRPGNFVISGAKEISESEFLQAYKKIMNQLPL